MNTKNFTRYLEILNRLYESETIDEYLIDRVIERLFFTHIKPCNYKSLCEFSTIRHYLDEGMQDKKNYSRMFRRMLTMYGWNTEEAIEEYKHASKQKQYYLGLKLDIELRTAIKLYYHYAYIACDYDVGIEKPVIWFNRGLALLDDIEDGEDRKKLIDFTDTFKSALLQKVKCCRLPQKEYQVDLLKSVKFKKYNIKE